MREENHTCKPTLHPRCRTTKAVWKTTHKPKVPQILSILNSLHLKKKVIGNRALNIRRIAHSETTKCTPNIIKTQTIFDPSALQKGMTLSLTNGTNQMCRYKCDCKQTPENVKDPQSLATWSNQI